MDTAKQINALHCACCDQQGTAVWRLHVRPRRLTDLGEFSAGFLCLDLGDHKEPFFICATCHVPALERAPAKPVAKIVAGLALHL